MLLKSFYYVHFVLSRLCRASKDKTFGEYRVNVLLLLAEINFVFGVLYLLMRERFGDISYPVYIGMFTPLFALHFYVFGNDRKRAEYEREFKNYSQSKRWKADILAVLVWFIAFFLPVIVHVITK